MLTKEQEVILRQQAKHLADKYIPDPNAPPKRGPSIITKEEWDRYWEAKNDDRWELYAR